MPSIQAMRRRLHGQRIKGGIFAGKDLRSAQGFQSVWERVTLTDCMAGMADFRQSSWVGTNIVNSAIYGANFFGSNLHDVELADVDAEQVNFGACILKGVRFVRCRLSYSSFAGSTLQDCAFIECNLHGADLDLIEGTAVEYRDCNLWSAKQALGCAFWNGKFDAKSCNRFAAMLARVHPDPAAKAALITLAGDNTYRAVDRLMTEKPDDGPEF